MNVFREALVGQVDKFVDKLRQRAKAGDLTAIRLLLKMAERYGPEERK